MTKFEAGQTYATRSIGDSNCWIRVTVASRTPSTIKADGKTYRVKEYDGAEFIRPWGNYSMAPILRATDKNRGA